MEEPWPHLQWVKKGINWNNYLDPSILFYWFSSQEQKRRKEEVQGIGSSGSDKHLMQVALPRVCIRVGGVVKNEPERKTKIFIFMICCIVCSIEDIFTSFPVLMSSTAPCAENYVGQVLLKGV